MNLFEVTILKKWNFIRVLACGGTFLPPGMLINSWEARSRHDTLMFPLLHSGEPEASQLFIYEAIPHM